MRKEKTAEKQYQPMIGLRNDTGLTRLGIMTNMDWDEDPRRLAIMLSRYKFIAKMLSGKSKVVEIGCGDAFGSRIVRQEVDSLCVTDFDPIFVADAETRSVGRWKMDCRIHDILKGPVAGKFEAAYSLDVIEHISKKDEAKYMANIVRSLNQEGVFIVGTPSIQSQVHASPMSKEGHVNCKDHKELRELMLRHFHNVFLFSMNDEVVHTGFYPMAHYLFAIGAGKR